MKHVYALIQYKPRLSDDDKTVEDDCHVASPFLFDRDYELREYKGKRNLFGKVIRMTVVEDWDELQELDPEVGMQEAVNPDEVAHELHKNLEFAVSLMDEGQLLKYNDYLEKQKEDK